MAIVIVHGIHTDGGALYEFGRELEKLGREVRYFDYPNRWALSMYFGTHKRDARALSNFMNDGDDVVAHSNGGLVWQESIRAGAKWNNCFVFGAAATSDDFEYADDGLNSAFIIYNVKDMALKLGALLPLHPFGKLGLRGFSGTPTKAIDRRFHNIRGFSEQKWKLDHSHYFVAQRDKWLKFVLDQTPVGTNKRNPQNFPKA